MYRLIIFLLAMAVLGSCGKGKEEEGAQTAQPAEQAEGSVPRPHGQAMIPDKEFSEFEEIAAAHIRPAFNAEGTDTLKEIAPGDYVDIYVVAEFNELYQMSAAEYRLQLPPGISVMSWAKMDSVVLTYGEHDRDFMLAFRCINGPESWLIKYVCKADEDFAGGEISTHPGANLDFLGFTLCDATRTLVRGRGGSATLRSK
jgi:hypothetical protein